MNTPEVPPAAPRRRIRWGWWVLGAFAASLAILAIGAIDTLTLSRDARALRGASFAALASRPNTQIEISANWLLLDSARTCLWFVKHVPDEARQALAAVRSASVGVYRLRHDISRQERVRLFAGTDDEMSKRGWTRMVGVINGDDTVLIYTRDGWFFSNTQRLCLVVCEPRQLVIVAAEADPAPLFDLAARKAHLACAD